MPEGVQPKEDVETCEQAPGYALTYVQHHLVVEAHPRFRRRLPREAHTLSLIRRT